MLKRARFSLFRKHFISFDFISFSAQAGTEGIQAFLRQRMWFRSACKWLRRWIKEHFVTSHHLLSHELLTENFLSCSSEDLSKERGTWGRGRKEERVTSSLLHLQSLIHVYFLTNREGAQFMANKELIVGILLLLKAALKPANTGDSSQCLAHPLQTKVCSQSAVSCALQPLGIPR